MEALSRFIIADDVELEDLSDHTHNPGVARADLPRKCLPQPASPPPLTKEFQHQEVTIAGAPVLLVRVSETGEEGYEIFVTREQAELIWQTLWQAGDAAWTATCWSCCSE